MVGIGVVVVGAGVLRRTSGSDTNIIDNTMSSIKLCCEQLIESSSEIAYIMEIPGSIPSYCPQVGKFFGVSGRYAKDSLRSSTIPSITSGRR